MLQGKPILYVLDCILTKITPKLFIVMKEKFNFQKPPNYPSKVFTLSPCRFSGPRG